MIIRIDDWPAAVRPITEESQRSCNHFIMLLEEEGINYHLGIVPALLGPKEFYFLKSLRNCIPCVHGWDHHHYEKSRICIANNDPLNKLSVRGDFDEMAGKSDEQIERELFLAMLILEEAFEFVDIYIPPNNIISEKTDKILEKIGYSRVLSENPPEWQTNLNYLQSDFYGKLRDYKPREEIVTLHCTWEADDLREFGEDWMREQIRKLKV